jgi:alkylation response protein AidB-like acyl-CoA dehydrogenase
MRRRLFEAEHEAFRESVRAFVSKEVTPHLQAWDAEGIVPRSLFTTAGAAGFLGMAIPEEFGGGGVSDFRFNAVLGEEVMSAGAAGAGLGLSLHNDICLPYFLGLATDEQQRRWLPGIASGELITAIAMTEPGMGSDLAGMATTAVYRSDHSAVGSTPIWSSPR